VETVYLREEQTNWLSSMKWSALKTYIQVALYRLNSIYVYICISIDVHMLYMFIIYICIYITIKRGYDLKESKKGYIGRFRGRK